MALEHWRRCRASGSEVGEEAIDELRGPGLEAWRGGGQGPGGLGLVDLKHEIDGKKKDFGYGDTN